LEFRDDLRKLTHLDLLGRRPVKSKIFEGWSLATKPVASDRK
jgi:hypothetical protein